MASWLSLLLLGVVAAQSPNLSGLVVYMTTDTPNHYSQVALLSASDNNTTTPKILTNFTSWNQFPTLSRDRTEVVWGSGVEYGIRVPPTLTHLYRVRVDQSAAPSRLTNNPMDLTEIWADWSPDGSQLVVVYSNHNSTAGYAANYDRMAIVNRDGSNWTPIMDDRTQGYNDYFAKWNPVDPDVILFQSDRSGNTGYYIYRLSTGNATQIPDLPPYSGATGNGPTWAADGSSFYYEALYGQDTFMVSATADGSVTKLFKVNTINTQYYSGVLEYIQCVNGPLDADDANYFVCTRSASAGDGISIVDHSGNLVKDLTSMGPETGDVYHWMPDWK